jgi:hypothetical protein
MDGLHPHEIFRHPECRRVSAQILKHNSRVVIYGESGSGTSMFVKAHCDIYWNQTFSKYILLDDETSTSEIFDEYPGILEGSHKFIYIDLMIPWTKNVLKLFFKKVPAKTKLIIVSPVFVQEFPCITVNTKCPNASYEFFCQNQHYFTFFKKNETLKYYVFFCQVKGKLSILMNKYVYNSDSIDLIDSIDPMQIRTLEDSDYLFEVKPDFDYTSFGTIQERCQLLENRSFCDVQVYDIYGYDFITESLRKNLCAYVWYQCVHKNLQNVCS